MKKYQRWTYYTAIFLIFIVLALYIRNEYMISYIRSPSMEPTYDTGDLVIIKYCGPNDIDVGDVIVFRSPYDKSMLILHRVVAIKKVDGKAYFLTKGDNNPDIDPWGWVPSDNLIGKLVARVPYIGYIFLAFDEIGARFLLALLVLLLGILYLSAGKERSIVFSPLLTFWHRNIRREILVLIVLLLLSLVALVATFGKSEGTANVYITRIALKELNGDNYLLVRMRIESKISYYESIYSIHLMVYYNNNCVGIGVWTIEYPFYGSKYVSIGILLNESVHASNLQFYGKIFVKNYLNGNIRQYVFLRNYP